MPVISALAAVCLGPANGPVAMICPELALMTAHEARLTTG